MRLLPTKAQPSVYADWLKAGDAPTVLIYGHYGECLLPCNPKNGTVNQSSKA